MRLRAYHPSEPPERVTRELGIAPTGTQLAGDPGPFPELGPVRSNGWFWYASFPVSNDMLREALEKVVGLFEGKRPALDGLRTRGWVFDLNVTWKPSLLAFELPDQLVAELATLGVQLRVSSHR
jgi:hypothetical protein